MTDLLQALSSRRRIPAEQLENAHRVRKYRNRIVHEQPDDGADPISLELAERFACRFFSFLPENW